MDKVERWLSTLADQEIDGRAGLKMLGNMSPEELKGCLTTCGLTQGAVGLIYQAINERRPSNHSAPSQSPGTVTITRHQSVGPLSPPSFAAMQPPPPRTPGSVDCASASANAPAASPAAALAAAPAAASTPISAAALAANTTPNADSAVASANSSSVCGICLADSQTDPFALPCDHAFCTACLATHVCTIEETRRGNSTSAGAIDVTADGVASGDTLRDPPACPQCRTTLDEATLQRLRASPAAATTIEAQPASTPAAAANSATGPAADQSNPTPVLLLPDVSAPPDAGTASTEAQPPPLPIADLPRVDPAQSTSMPSDASGPPNIGSGGSAAAKSTPKVTVDDLIAKGMTLDTPIIELRAKYAVGEGKAKLLHEWLNSDSKPDWAPAWSTLRDIRATDDEDLVRRVGKTVDNLNEDSLLSVWRAIRQLPDATSGLQVDSPRRIKALGMWRTLIGAMAHRRCLQADLVEQAQLGHGDLEELGAEMGIGQVGMRRDPNPQCAQLLIGSCCAQEGYNELRFEELPPLRPQGGAAADVLTNSPQVGVMEAFSQHQSGVSGSAMLQLDTEGREESEMHMQADVTLSTNEVGALFDEIGSAAPPPELLSVVDPKESLYEDDAGEMGNGARYSASFDRRIILEVDDDGRESPEGAENWRRQKPDERYLTDCYIPAGERLADHLVVVLRSDSQTGSVHFMQDVIHRMQDTGEIHTPMKLKASTAKCRTQLINDGGRTALQRQSEEEYQTRAEECANIIMHIVLEPIPADWDNSAIPEERKKLQIRGIAFVTTGPVTKDEWALTQYGASYWDDDDDAEGPRDAASSQSIATSDAMSEQGDSHSVSSASVSNDVQANGSLKASAAPRPVVETASPSEDGVVRASAVCDDGAWGRRRDERIERERSRSQRPDYRSGEQNEMCSDGSNSRLSSSEPAMLPGACAMPDGDEPESHVALLRTAARSLAIRSEDPDTRNQMASSDILPSLDMYCDEIGCADALVVTFNALSVTEAPESDGNARYSSAHMRAHAMLIKCTAEGIHLEDFATEKDAPALINMLFADKRSTVCSAACAIASKVDCPAMCDAILPAVPQLVALLGDDEEEVWSVVTNTLYQLAHSSQLVKDVARQLVAALSVHENVQQQLLALHIIDHLTDDHQSTGDDNSDESEDPSELDRQGEQLADDAMSMCKTVVDAGVIQPTVAMLSSDFKEVAVSVLANLTASVDDSCAQVVEARAVPPLVRLLEDADVQGSAAEILANLTASVDDSGAQVVEARAVPLLVRLLESSDTVTQYNTMQILANLTASVDDSGAQVVEARAVPPLVRLLESEDVDVQGSTLRVLANLTASVGDSCAQVVEARAVPLLVHLLKSEDADVQNSAVYVLANLTARAQDSCTLVIEAVPLLVNLLESSEAVTQYNAVTVLANLAVGHPLSIADADVISRLEDLTQSSDADLVAAARRAIGVIRASADGVAPMEVEPQEPSAPPANWSKPLEDLLPELHRFKHQLATVASGKIGPFLYSHIFIFTPTLHSRSAAV